MTGAPLRLAFQGELDLHAARGLRATLNQAVGDSASEPVVDLRDVTFIDSTALGVLVHAAEQMRRQGRTLELLVTDGPVMELLTTSGLVDRFHIVAPA